MTGSSEYSRLGEHAHKVFCEVCTTPNGPLEVDQRKQLFDVFGGMAKKIHDRLERLLQTAPDDRRVEILALLQTATRLDSINVQTRSDALDFLTRTLGLDRLSKSYLPDEESEQQRNRICPIPDAVLLQMNPIEDRFIRLLTRYPGKTVSLHDIHRVLYFTPLEPDQPREVSKIATLAGAVGKLVQQFGKVQTIRGQGYLWEEA